MMMHTTMRKGFDLIDRAGEVAGNVLLILAVVWILVVIACALTGEVPGWLLLSHEGVRS